MFNDPRITAAIITAVASIIVTLLGKVQFDKIISKRFRDQKDIPDIVGTVWAAEWYFEDDELYVKDEITLEQWTRKGHFEGHGEVLHDDTKYKYPITGEVTASRIVVLTYKAEAYPTEGNIGTACMDLSDGAKKLRGRWAGRASGTADGGEKVSFIRGGRVTMKRIR